MRARVFAGMRAYVSAFLSVAVCVCGEGGREGEFACMHVCEIAGFVSCRVNSSQCSIFLSFKCVLVSKFHNHFPPCGRSIDVSYAN